MFYWIVYASQFYRDTLEDLPESSNEKKEVEKGEDSPPALECMQTDENVPIVDINNGDQQMNDSDVKVLGEMTFSSYKNNIGWHNLW